MVSKYLVFIPHVGSLSSTGWRRGLSTGRRRGLDCQNPIPDQAEDVGFSGSVFLSPPSPLLQPLKLQFWVLFETVAKQAGAVSSERLQRLTSDLCKERKGLGLPFHVGADTSFD